MMRDPLGRLAIALPRNAESILPIVVGGVLLVLLAPAVLVLPAFAAIAVPFSLVVGLLMVARPKESLLAIFALRMLVDLLWWIDASVGGMNVMELFSGSVAAFSCVLVLLNIEKIQKHPYFVPFLPFAFVMAIGALRSGDPRDAAEVLARYVSPVLLMFLVTVLFDEDKDRKRMMVMIPAIAVIPVMLGFYHWATGQMNDDTVLHGYARLSGAYHNIHNHGHAMALFGCVGLFWARWYGKSWKSAAMIAFAAACFTLMFLTYVRTALMGVLAFTAVFLLLEREWKWLIAGAVGGALALSASAVVQDRFSDIFVMFTADSESGVNTGKLGSGRVAIWTDMMVGYLKRPSFDILFGVGLGKHDALSYHRLDSHNDYLALLFQMGPIALVAYLWFQWLIFVRGIRLALWGRDRWESTFGSFLVAFDAMVLFANFLSNSYLNRIHQAWLFWGIAGLVFAMEFAQKESAPKPVARSGATAEVPAPNGQVWGGGPAPSA